ncbi:helix-turn-helix domain-containing protein [Streptomyces alkaliterrae]|uniref:Helix-turn-helix domain-containing protein n=1 Tax=Streptomyces alkaliterrae TaxID=2213162 RepID=A0A5P0YPM4_9ACTN|nr:helix-turn-helix transcriptional regulator [Streptomyces alkaliterrae]MBB1256059.1 helix-turn-helix domain-containing protein [Streptomyces alkaliterrae]MBB1257761.1 helix-turn-helix domain-containing protein [Streptomyces alkaliterrae]MQS01372.1 helix-turn-helix transcriptional regulator [Streptomyces alkaliterrae]
MLEPLGLDTFTEAVYRAMLCRPGEPATALAQQLGASPQEVRRAWDRLAELDLVQRPSEPLPGAAAHAGAADVPIPVSPEVGLEHLLAGLQTELARHRQRVAAARATASRLAVEYAELRTRESPVAVEHLADLDEVRARLATLTDEVEAEVMAFVPGGAQTAENMVAARPLNERLLRRGVAMRTVYLDSVRNDPATVAHARWLTEQGGHVRTVATLPVRMTLVDRRTAVLPVDSDDTGRGAVVLTGKGPLAALCGLFESVWDTAQPLGRPCRRGDDEELDRQEAAALRLLAEGHTDEGIAKRLGISHRTARRIATVLMERLGARSRFEAGVRAMQRGWLPPEP